MESRILGCVIYRFGTEVGILGSEKVRLLRKPSPAVPFRFGQLEQLNLCFCHNASFQFGLGCYD